MIYKEGHEIGNHAYSHPDLQRRSKSETIQEIGKTNNVIEETIGVKPKWFAPPSGSFNKVTIQVADGLGTMISGIKGKGYQLGTASELMNEKRINK